MHPVGQLRERIASGTLAPAQFRAALHGVAPRQRDVWFDELCGLSEIPDDAALPAGCVPYLPCPVGTLLDVIDDASIGQDDVVVDVGCGVGRALMLLHLATGASGVGLEIQPQLAEQAFALAARLQRPAVRVRQGDAVLLAEDIAAASVFFLYCPFSGERLHRLMQHVQRLAHRRPLRVCCVDMPLPPCPWLQPLPSSTAELCVYRSLGPA